MIISFSRKVAGRNDTSWCLGSQPPQPQRITIKQSRSWFRHFIKQRRTLFYVFLSVSKYLSFLHWVHSASKPSLMLSRFFFSFSASLVDFFSPACASVFIKCSGIGGCGFRGSKVIDSPAVGLAPALRGNISLKCGDPSVLRRLLNSICI